MGVLNLVGRDRLSRYEFAQLVCQVLDLDARMLVPQCTEEMGQVARRPLQAGLTNARHAGLVYDIAGRGRWARRHEEHPD